MALQNKAYFLCDTQYLNVVLVRISECQLKSLNYTGQRLISEIKYASTVTSICVLVTF